MIDSIRTAAKLGRRTALKALGMGATVAFLGARTTARAYGEVMDYITSRIKAVYAHDTTMRYRKSQNNPMVQKLYTTCFSNGPMCEEAEHHLHAEYTDRSEGIEDIRNF